MADDPDLKQEIACAAARLIADEGCDYATAKRRAARELLGDHADRRGALPDNAQVEAALREHLQLFGGEAHPARLAALRALALQMMERLATFNPHLVGAVLNGTATEHSDLHLHLFTDSAKDVEIFLLNEGVAFDVDEPATEAAEETIRFVVRPARGRGMPERLGVSLDVHATDAIRTAARGRSTDPGLHPVEQSGRAGLAAVRELVAAAGGEV